MRFLTIACLLFLAACARSPDSATGQVVYRDQAAPIASRATVDWARMQGDWIVIEGAPDGIFGLPGNTMTLDLPRLIVERPDRPGARLIEVAIDGPGRLSQVQGAAPLWILWVDDGYRTVAIGTPDGSFGWIMDRDPAPARDRLRAAREVLAWYGYDLTAFRGSGL
ncbi:lipocalin family protein [Aestuariibius sp. 2305UL40-4]|uniref:lipocalin family protein n=1 Tax=Aestuariibius violaceus TaxID=3234132 RepID=UPI00345E9032